MQRCNALHEALQAARLGSPRVGLEPREDSEIEAEALDCVTCWDKEDFQDFKSLQNFLLVHIYFLVFQIFLEPLKSSWKDECCEYLFLEIQANKKIANIFCMFQLQNLFFREDDAGRRTA